LYVTALFAEGFFVTKIKKEIIMKTKHIFFDVDSTLVMLEGLDYLAEIKGHKEIVEQLTTQAMNGNLSMREAMETKVNLLRPSHAELVAVGEAYLKHMVPGAKETIEELQKQGYTIWLLTGNFLPAVKILAMFLNIPLEHVITNQILFDEDGAYVSFNADHPLAHNHGKTEIIKSLVPIATEAIMVGDGVTDLATKSVVELFIGFGGVVRRPKVAEEADVYIPELDLRKILPHLRDLIPTGQSAFDHTKVSDKLEYR
jgi:phosphoserine phosphatase